MAKKIDSNGNEIQEYPKLIYLSTGKLIVNNEKEEADAMKDEPKAEKPAKDKKVW